jgi:hypothetical protein
VRGRGNVSGGAGPEFACNDGNVVLGCVANEFPEAGEAQVRFVSGLPRLIDALEPVGRFRDAAGVL